jgi:predicted PurR-regulated permease PerM
MDKIKSRLINIILITGIIYLLYLMRNLLGDVVVKIYAIFKPFLIGFVLAYAFYPFLKFLQRKLPKWLGIVIILLIVFGILAYIIINIIPVFTNELADLLSGLMQFLKDVDKKFDVDLSGIEDALIKAFNKISKEFTDDIAVTGGKIINASINVISNFIISLVAFIYLLIDMDKIREKIKKYFKLKSKKTYNLVRDIDVSCTAYFKGLFINVLIMFIEYTLLYRIIGHPNFLLLGIIAAFSPLIPYFGGIIMNVVAIITASVISPTLLILCLIICLIFPQIDGYLIVPKIYGKTNKVPALVTIFAVFAGGVLGGFEGIIVALPIAIIIQTIYKNYDDEISQKINDIKEKI